MCTLKFVSVANKKHLHCKCSRHGLGVSTSRQELEKLPVAEIHVS